MQFHPGHETKNESGNAGNGGNGGNPENPPDLSNLPNPVDDRVFPGLYERQPPTRLKHAMDGNVVGGFPEQKWKERFIKSYKGQLFKRADNEQVYRKKKDVFMLGLHYHVDQNDNIHSRQHIRRIGARL